MITMTLANVAVLWADDYVKSVNSGGNANCWGI